MGHSVVPSSPTNTPVRVIESYRFTVAWGRGATGSLLGTGPQRTPDGPEGYRPEPGQNDEIECRSAGCGALKPRLEGLNRVRGRKNDSNRSQPPREAVGWKDAEE